MILQPAASRAFETEVRMLRSSSTSAIVGMVPPSMDRRAPARHFVTKPVREQMGRQVAKVALLEGLRKTCFDAAREVMGQRTSPQIYSSRIVSVNILYN